MCNYTGSKWNHWNGNKIFEGKFGAVPGNRLIDSLQKMTNLGTSHIIREGLEVGIFSSRVPGENGLRQETTTKT